MTESKSRFKWYLGAFWLVFVSAVSGLFLLFYGIANYEIFGDLPDIYELENPKSHLATEILSSDGKLLGTIFKENRSMCDYDELSPYLPQALIATEDERFRSHSGIDGESLLRAVVFLGSKGGGSTITQQLAKMLFTDRVSKSIVERVGQKLNEWVIAVQLERHYTKNEIIGMYLNRLDFVNNAAGIKSASNVYFSKQPMELEIQEAAMLVGMAKNPALFNPIRRPDTTMHRRNVALYQMMRNDLITQGEFDSLKTLPLGLKLNRASHKEGLATYFREEVRGQIGKIFRKLKKADGSDYDIYRDGLRIYTTINYKMQEYAENAVKTHLGTELQSDFFLHWEKKSEAAKTFAPYYFEGMTKEQKKEMVDNLILRGIRTSGRYKKALDSREKLRDRSRKYHKVYFEMTQLENKKSRFEERRFKRQQELNRFNRDTTPSAEVIRQKNQIRNALNLVKDSIAYYQDKIEELQGPFDKAKSRYMELWKPFDDTMQVEFKKPIPMEIFTWNGPVDTVMSPRDSVIHHKWYLRAGMMSIDPKTGFIKAWVGGIDYKFFQYDQVRGTRQVGSTFKPFVYATAIENGVSPCERVLNEDVRFPKGMYGLEEAWSPKNSTPSDLDGELVTLKMALANSINSVSAKIMKDFGPLAVIDVARRCGITTAIDPVPSICLGTPDVSLFEMVSAYGVFANKGIWIAPSFILRIEDRNGSTIWTPTPKRREAMTEENAYKMLEVLGGVAAYGPKVNGKSTYGTGVRLRSPNRPYGNIPYSIKIAGKTGTTQNQSDGWFMGVTPDLVTGVWVGCEDRAAHFTSLRLGMGTNMALPIWGYYMNSIYKDDQLKVSKDWFEVPSGLSKEEFDCSKMGSGADQANPFGGF